MCCVRGAIRFACDNTTVLGIFLCARLLLCLLIRPVGDRAALSSCPVAKRVRMKHLLGYNL